MVPDDVVSPAGEVGEWVSVGRQHQVHLGQFLGTLQ